MYGPTQYQVVKIHNNVPPSSQCVLKSNHQPQGHVLGPRATLQAAARFIAPGFIISSTHQPKTPKVFASTSTTTPMTQKSTGAA